VTVTVTAPKGGPKKLTADSLGSNEDTATV
jgi:hypothetical protein